MFNMEISSRHISGAWYFKLLPIFGENCAPLPKKIILIFFLVNVTQITGKLKCHICLCICCKETSGKKSLRLFPALNGDERSFSRPGCFAASTHRFGDLREGLDLSKKRQISSL
jgi:hypothetical protein